MGTPEHEDTLSDCHAMADSPYLSTFNVWGCLLLIAGEVWQPPAFMGVRETRSVQTDKKGLQRAQGGSVPGSCGKSCGSGGLGLYKAVETDAHSCRAGWEMSTQTHSSPPDTPRAGCRSADSIRSRRNVLKPSWRKRATVPVYARLSWGGFGGNCLDSFKHWDFV